MRILHYFLGFPPYRTGGLTKFAFDLMSSQAEKGDVVFALWPGQINFHAESVRIKKRKNVGRIGSYEIINPLPVPLDEGIRDVGRFIQSTDKRVFIEFLSSLHINAIHIHTLMGLHKEFLEAARELEIKTVFTTHDYFGICPKVTLFKNGNICMNSNNCRDCVKCNENALSYNKIMILQSPLYRILKNSPVVKKLRQKHRGNFFEEQNEAGADTSNVSDAEAQKYRKLRKYYKDMLEMINLIHFNSTVAESIYKRYIKPENSIVMTISNKEIADNTALKKKPLDKIRLTFLSPAKPFKGYSWVKQTLDKMWNEGKRDFILNLYTKVPVSEPYMNIKEEGFTRDELADIFRNTDVLLAPSIWYETFGFTVIEALSYGTPVIVSDRVGAKDIIGDCGIVVDASDKASLYDAVLNCGSLRFSNNIKIRKWDEYVLLNDKNYQ